MRRLLSKPFKIPIPGYELSRRFLGVRLSGPRRALHDPDDANALIVYAPPELSEHERLKIDPYAYIHISILSLKYISCIVYSNNLPVSISIIFKVRL